MDNQQEVKKKKSRFHIVMFLYALLQGAYGAYTYFTHDLTFGLVWMVLGAIGLLLCILLRKQRFLPFLISLVMLATIVGAGAILYLGADQDTDSAKYAFVLGYKLDKDKMTNTLKYRLDKAYDYAYKNENCTLVLCGGVTEGNTKSEALVMYDYLVDKGIDETRLVTESRSLNTKENIKNALDAIDESGKIVVISSNYHLMRAKQICKKCEIKALGVGAKAPLELLPNQLMIEEIVYLLSLIG